MKNRSAFLPYVCIPVAV